MHALFTPGTAMAQAPVAALFVRADSVYNSGENARQQLRLYGLTPECYERMLAEQGGGCAICQAKNPGMKHASRLYVDHCHISNRVRGLLCRACNTMLGAARDRAETLRAGEAYLER